jgi:hypothetical protein
MTGEQSIEANLSGTTFDQVGDGSTGRHEDTDSRRRP